MIVSAPKKGVDNIFSNQFGILGLQETWITPDEIEWSRLMCFSVVVLGFKKVPVDLFSYWLLSVLHFHMLSCLPGTAVMVCSSGCVISLVCLFLHKDFTKFYRHILILMPGDSQNYIHLHSQKHMTVAASRLCRSSLSYQNN